MTILQNYTQWSKSRDLSARGHVAWHVSHTVLTCRASCYIERVLTMHYTVFD